MNTADIIRLVIIGIGAYAIGNINPSIIIGKIKGIDIRKEGSGNAGMTNTIRVMGLTAGIIVFIVDVMKAFIAVSIGYNLGGEPGAMAAFAGVVLGHCFPAVFGFKGGKGVVTTAVAILMCNPIVFAILFLLFVIIVLFTKYISLGSVVCVMLYPLLLDSISRIFTGSPTPYVVFAMITAVVVVVKHWGNIKRLAAGKESKFSFKKSVKAPEEKTEQSVEENKEDK